MYTFRYTIYVDILSKFQKKLKIYPIRCIYALHTFKNKFTVQNHLVSYYNRLILILPFR